MIYWFIGQPGCGKTTLAKRLKAAYNKDHSPAIHLDGDDLRKIYGNVYAKENFTKEYRIEQTRILQRFAAHIADQGIAVIISTVNPYRDVREEFKKSRKDVKEIYVLCEGRVRQEFWSKDYEAPRFVEPNCKWINTTDKTEEESFQLLCDALATKKIFATMVSNVMIGGVSKTTSEYFDTQEEYDAWCKVQTPEHGGFPIVYVQEKNVI